MQTAAGSGEATGTISSGQQLTCTITNTIGPAPLPGVLLAIKSVWYLVVDHAKILLTYKLEVIILSHHLSLLVMGIARPLD